VPPDTVQAGFPNNPEILCAAKDSLSSPLAWVMVGRDRSERAGPRQLGLSARSAAKACAATGTERECDTGGKEFEAC